MYDEYVNKTKQNEEWVSNEKVDSIVKHKQLKQIKHNTCVYYQQSICMCKA